MKVIYSFMIGLILFNFYACTKQQIEEPLGVYNNIENSKLEFIYLDDKNNATEDITDTILMKLQNDTSGFVMASRKIGENEYATSLIDTNSNSSISMYYKNGESFPYKILLVSEEESIIGYTSIYRKDSEDFDIIWYSDSETGEACKNIPLKNTVYNHVKTSGVAASSDYQVRTIEVSVRIADAINKYVEKNDKDSPNPVSRRARRRFTWRDFCNLWRRIIAPIVIAIAVVVAIVVPILVPAVAGTVVGSMGGVIGAVAGVAVALGDTDKAEESSPGEKALLITKDKKEDYYKDGDIIHLKEAGSEAIIYFDILDAPIDYLNVKVYMTNDNEGYKAISGYFEFNTNNNGYKVLYSEYVIKDGKINKDKDIELKIKKRTIPPVGFGQFYLIIETGNNVMLNREASSGLKLIFE